jgi:hypothetical protein
MRRSLLRDSRLLKIAVVAAVIVRAGIHGCSHLLRHKRIHIEELGDASAQKTACSVQFRTLQNVMPVAPSFGRYGY